MIYDKKLWKITKRTIFIIVAFLAYIFIIHPILGAPFKDFEEYRGVEYYTEGEYLDFENGLLFQKTLESYEFLSNLTVLDFYYSDNQWKDSFVYGKKPDVYGVLLDPGEDYEKVKAIIEKEGILDAELSSWDSDKALNVYLMPLDKCKENIKSVFIVGCEKEYLSYIMITDIVDDGQKRTYSAISDVIQFWSTLPF